MVKHTQTVRRQKPTKCLIVFYHFVGLVLKGLKSFWGTRKESEKASINTFHTNLIDLFNPLVPGVH